MSAATKSVRISESEKLTRFPTLGQMIREARADQHVIRRATQEALSAWFRQSERLNIARREHKLRGPRFLDFARRIGISDQTTAYQLFHLHRYRAKIIRRCVDNAAAAAKRGQVYRYPGWETALGWFHMGRNQPRGRFWITPLDIYRDLDAEFHFTFDPCPYPEGFNSLEMEWGKSNYVNPPFRKGDVFGERGTTAFVRKAIAEQQKGKTSVVVLPVHDYVTILLKAGAEIRPLGRTGFLDIETGEPAPHPSNTCLFVLRGKRAKH